ncbi:MAG: secretin and TonB N-terminal domain-containing protein [Candidatus Omnitrophica bacterium]|nr:secretin and TonB N-terminal domain-containing protein [Candidatus Omnitrophota bacterium]
MKKIITLFLVFAWSLTGYAQTPSTQDPSQNSADATSETESASAVIITESEAPENPPNGRTPSEEAAFKLPPGHVNLDFKEADIRSVLRVIALKGGVNIVAGPEVVGTVTVRLQNVPWEKALEVVLKTYGYVFERDGNVVRVTTKDRIDQEQLESLTFFLNYSTATEVADAVSELLTDRGKVKAVVRTNTVIVTDTAANLYKVSQVVHTLDQKTPQAYIDSKIIAVQLDETENLGIDWNVAGTLRGAAIPTTFPFNAGERGPIPTAQAPTFMPIIAASTLPTVNPLNPRAFPILGANVASTIVGQTYTLGTLSLAAFTATLNFLKTRGDTKVVSNPRIVVLNNQTAKVQVGQQIYIPNFELNEQTGAYVVNDFEKRDVGVLMNVTPHINTTEEILVDVKPEVSTFLGYSAVSTGLSAPSFGVTTASTQVMIQDGETIAIGGLMTDNRSSTFTRVPILGDIPWVGNIFRAKRETVGSGNSKVETLFFITVGIVDTEGQPARESLHPQITNPSMTEAKVLP